MPKVSVCIPTYNRASFLIYAVDSVLSQSYSDFEIIICDDGSTDHTSEVISQWHDPRIHYIKHAANIGRSQNMRSGFAASAGTYFIKFDDDDALTPQFLEKTVAVLEAEPRVDFVCTNHWIINQKTRELSQRQWQILLAGERQDQAGVIPDLITETFKYQSLQVGSTLFRRTCLAEVDYMRPEADGCEDFDLLVRLAIAGKRGYFLPEFLMEYRLHGGQTSLKQNIHFLSAKAFCINSYKFLDEELEKLRLMKLAGTQQALGLRMIEQGETLEGRRLLRESTRILGGDRKTMLGLVLSYLPISWRRLAFHGFRQIRSKDYAEQVREAVS